MIVPISTPASVATVPTKSEMRAPQITRESTSRPKASVPNQCSAEGGSSFMQHVLRVGIVGRDPRREERDQRHRDDEHEPDASPPERVARFQAEGAAITTGGAATCGGGAHAVFTRGSTRP